MIANEPDILHALGNPLTSRDRNGCVSALGFHADLRTQGVWQKQHFSPLTSSESTRLFGLAFTTAHSTLPLVTMC